MKLKVLGTQSPYSTNGHHCPGFLIKEDEYKIMLDCGSGTHSLLNMPNDLKNLNIILTHLHEDHYNDIGILQYAAFTNHNLKQIDKEINVWLPYSPSDKYLKIVDEENSYTVYNGINENLVVTIGNMNISFLKTVHPIETYAVKICNGIKTIVYTSDMSFLSKEQMVKFASGADLLICESSLLQGYGFPEINSHLTAHQAGIIAREASVGCLMLTHFWPHEPPENYVIEAKYVFDNVIAAQEGIIIEL